MSDLDLTRSPDDRRLYVLDGMGSLHLEGWGSRHATATAREGSWRLARGGLFKATVEATDLAGAPAGRFEGRSVRRGGTLRWHDRELELRPASAWRERYALVENGTELAVLDGRGWGKRPVKVKLDDAQIDPGLLLFAAYVVRGLADDASAAAGSGAAAAAGASG
ncbi:MAG TPA: hypothetical protein VMY78_09250 [Solirubrobacteraceae bacterium]|nr:hypothetical protein [Solirubrobacteraceae bacterium]